MKYTEIFETIQGEGPMQGRPCTFVRLAGCNLNCPWCDTKYSHNHTQGEVISPNELATTIYERMKCADSYTRPVVFTGGEPMLQQVGILETCKIFSTMSAMKPHVWFETNGTVRPYSELDTFCEPRYVISPKVEAVNSVIMAKFPPDRSYLKFVMDGHMVGTPESGNSWEWNWSQQEIETISRSVFGHVDPERIFLMPKANTRDELLVNGPRVWQFCTEQGYAFSARLHMIFYSSQRGV